MRRLHIAVCTILLAGTVAFAQPTTQPDGRRGGPAARGLQPRPGPARGPTMTREERRAAEEWAQARMPHLSRAIASAPPQSAKRQRLSAFAVTQMRLLNDARDDAALVEKLNQNIKALDAIIEADLALETAAPEAQKDLRQKIQDMMRGIVDDVIQERAKRIENIQARLALEEARLKEDQANRDQIVTRRLRAMNINLQDAAVDGAAAAGVPDAPQKATESVTGDRPPQ